MCGQAPIKPFCKRWGPTRKGLLESVPCLRQYPSGIQRNRVSEPVPTWPHRKPISRSPISSYLPPKFRLGECLLWTIEAIKKRRSVRFYESRDISRDLLEAIIEAGATRMRPILITALTTIFAMLPIALGFGEGGEALQPLGAVVVGGLATSTFLTLIIIPCVYSLVDRLSKKKAI